LIEGIESGSCEVPEEISSDFIHCLISKEDDIPAGKFSWCKGPAVSAKVIYTKVLEDAESPSSNQGYIDAPSNHRGYIDFPDVDLRNIGHREDVLTFSSTSYGTERSYKGAVGLQKLSKEHANPKLSKEHANSAYKYLCQSEEGELPVNMGKLRPAVPEKSNDFVLHVGEHSFSRMEEAVDRQRLLGGGLDLRDLRDPALVSCEAAKRERYLSLLRQASTTDLAEISGIGLLYQCGTDRRGRPVIVFCAKWFKFAEINLDKALLYLVKLLEPIASSDYVIVYFHTLTTAANHPSMAWIRRVYDVLEYKHKKHLKAFYIVHPTLWTKIMTWWFTTFMAPQIKDKVHTVTGVEYLYDIMDPDQLEVPAYIMEYDMTVNGLRYYKGAS